MYIKTIKIRNFRKLEEVAIDFECDKTIFIGANNSGKTSTITAISLFLNNQKFSHYDFSLSNHPKINLLFEADQEPSKQEFDSIFPTIDLWLNVKDKDIHYVSQLLPTLDWSGVDLGVRLRYEIKDISKLYAEYKIAREKVKDKNGLFPKDMIDYLSKNLSANFEIRRYILDPAKKEEVQNQDSLGDALEENPLYDLIKINTINAQRGMNDEVADVEQSEKRKLTALMANYYSSHLDPNKGEMTEEDIRALAALHTAKETFTCNVRSNFEPVLQELSTIGYPPFGAPNITINPQVSAMEGINHSNALQYKTENGLCLPESYNGLGYQNLIFITFKMIGFRDSWIQYGKMKSNEKGYSPIHLVLIEEPEAHLHPQAQQVFIKRAYDILTGRAEIKENGLTTQMIVSTHSSHITHECKFTNLRYFKRRIPGSDKNQNPTTDIVNLTDIFENNQETERFVTRYIKINHCDLFFADAAILIEGDAERILMPHFIAKFSHLFQSYVCVLTIGGSHAHRLKPLMEKLCIPTLIITDLDGTPGGNTTNPTLKKWIPAKENVNELLAITSDDKIKNNPFPLRVAYQTGNNERTFEDALQNENQELTRNVNGRKAEFALNLLDLENFDNETCGLKTPRYIEEGLEWLNNILQKKLEQKPFIENMEDKNV